MQQQMAFYGEMPDSYQLVLNADHPYIQELITQSELKEKDELKATVTADAKLKQMIDLALLAGGQLKGEALSHFVQRSFNLI